MEKLELDYLNCEQPFKNDFDLNQHSKGMNLTIDLPTSQDSKFITPVVANFLHYNSYNDEFKSSPILYKESSTNPFEETFRQAALNPFKQTNFDNQNTEVDNNESLNTPSIDLDCFESASKKLNVNKLYQNGTCSKLDLLISASDDQIFNTFDDQNNNLKNSSNQISQFNDSKETPVDNVEKRDFKMDTSVEQQIKTNKRALPKLDANSNEMPAYKVFLKLPDGSSLDLSSVPATQTTTIVPNYSQLTTKTANTQINDLNINSNATQLFEESISIDKNHLEQINKTSKRMGRKRKAYTTKKTIADKNIETTTLKSIKNALSDSTSQLSPSLSSTTEIMKCDSFCSQSSQSSNTSSYYGQSSKDTLNENSYLDLVTSSASSSQSSSVNGKITDANNKSKPGRRSKNEPKEDPKEKKIRSLERNREAASRCRTKRKRWVNALEEKADELEQQNKELHITYDKLKREVALLRSAMLINKTNSIDNANATITSNNLSNISTNTLTPIADNPVIDQPNQTFKSSSNLFDALLQVAKNSETN